MGALGQSGAVRYGGEVPPPGHEEVIQEEPWQRLRAQRLRGSWWRNVIPKHMVLKQSSAGSPHPQCHPTSALISTPVSRNLALDHPGLTVSLSEALACFEHHLMF